MIFLSLFSLYSSLFANNMAVDAHADTLQWILYENTNLGKKRAEGHWNIPRARAGGVKIQVMALWVDSVFQEQEAVRQTERLLDCAEKFLRQNKNSVRLIRTVRDLDEVLTGDKIGIILSIEGGHAISGSLKNLQRFFDRGVRAMTLTWSNTNEIGDSSGDKEGHGGLSGFGKRVVSEMERLGMTVDVSHASDKTFRDVLRISKKPVLASHSSCRALTGHHRNLTDEMLGALGKNGGVVAINFYSKFLDERMRKRKDSKKPQSLPRRPENPLEQGRRNFYEIWDSSALPRPPLSALTLHIQHAVSIAGENHVGLGSDFDGAGNMPLGMDGPQDFPNMARVLLKTGFSQGRVEKIFSKNLIRIFRQTLPP